MVHKCCPQHCCCQAVLTERLTFFSMEHMAKHHPCCQARLTSRASIHSDLPELGTPVMMVSSPGTTCTALVLHFLHRAGVAAGGLVEVM